MEIDQEQGKAAAALFTLALHASQVRRQTQLRRKYVPEG